MPTLGEYPSETLDLRRKDMAYEFCICDFPRHRVEPNKKNDAEAGAIVALCLVCLPLFSQTSQGTILRFIASAPVSQSATGTAKKRRYPQYVGSPMISFCNPRVFPRHYG